MIDAQTGFVALFNAGWFIESLWFQTLVIHMIRTKKYRLFKAVPQNPFCSLPFGYRGGNQHTVHTRGELS
ncbi:hypothetical protein [Desulfosporosinus sp. FKA]|uniref:hypothetical protein n=1 Tax=Desulfosporosinus sp. FKA TaxID=1969834 RepID=UPI001124EF37|nr:hypothetical protein [Desulfosporosinus sp. FKA]